MLGTGPNNKLQKQLSDFFEMNIFWCSFFRLRKSQFQPVGNKQIKIQLSDFSKTTCTFLFLLDVAVQGPGGVSEPGFKGFPPVVFPVRRLRFDRG